MKRKLLIVIFAIVTVLFCTAIFAGCEDLTVPAKPGTDTEQPENPGGNEDGDPPVGHTHSYTETVVPPTCTEQGYTLHTCSCGDEYKDTYVDATGHTYVDTVVAPTCTEQGYTLHTCSCGDEYKDTYVDATGHKYTNYVYNYDATCIANGTETAVCDNGCKAEDTREKADSVTGIHIYESEKCKYCDIDIVYSEGLKFNEDVRNDDIFGYFVAGLGTCTDKDIVIPKKYKSLPVTSIETSAFSGRTGIRSIAIPDSVTSIGYSAFSGCTGLMSVTIPDSVTYIGDHMFDGCTGLTNITIPDGVTYIGYGAFYRCTGLKNITIPDSVTRIGDSAFEKCFGYTSVTIGNSVTNIGKNAFEPRNFELTRINYTGDLGSWCNISGLENLMSSGKAGKELFINNVKIDGTLTIPDSVTYISSCAFFGCKELTSVTIPDSVTDIGNSAFYHCTGLMNITIPDSVTSIGSSAFEGCAGLICVTIGNSVTKIGDSAFFACPKLVEVYNKSNLKIAILSTDFGNVGYNAGNIYTPDRGKSKLHNIDGYIFYLGRYLVGYNGDDTRLILPNNYEGNNYEIYEYAFAYNDRIKSITIPDSVTCIGLSAFSDCIELINVNVGNGVTAISDYEFLRCTGLLSVTIGNGVTTIGESAFEGCTGLTDVYYKGSQEDWESITVGSYNTPLTSAAIHYDAE